VEVEVSVLSAGVFQERRQPPTQDDLKLETNHGRARGKRGKDSRVKLRRAGVL